MKEWDRAGMGRQGEFMSIANKVIRVLWPAIIVGTLFFVPWPLTAYTDLDAERASALLVDAKAEALQLKLDASDMASFNQSALNWKSHVDKLTEIREHVNKVGESVAQLKLVRSGAAPWQQVAIDRVIPLMRELALNVQATIGHLRMNQDRLQGSDYKDYLTTTAELASKMASLISDFVEYSETRAKLVKLSQRLEIEEQ